MRPTLADTSPAVRPPADATSAGDAPDLVSRLIARDERAFEELVRTHGPRLLSVASRYLPHLADAEDALQDTFVNVVRSIDGFQRASSLETWLHRVVVNAALTSLRQRARRTAAPLDASVLEGEVAWPAGRPPPATALQRVTRGERRDALRRAVDGLPAAPRTLVLLRDVAALGIDAIAELLDVEISVVRVRLHRAHRALRAALGPQLAASNE